MWEETNILVVRDGDGGDSSDGGTGTSVLLDDGSLADGKGSTVSALVKRNPFFFFRF